MELIRLSPRMAAIAAFIPEGSRAVDVGTDHGYIPVWLAQTGQAEAIAATDINPGPLASAQRSAAEYGVSDKIHFALCSGLDFPGSDAYDTVVIAGMGGELICSILAAAPWTKAHTRLILQPNSKIETLNGWLGTNGYALRDARLVKDNGKLYQVLVAEGDTTCLHPATGSLVDRLLLERQDPLLPEYLDGLIRKQRHALEGLAKGQHTEEQTARAMELLKELQELRKETESWQR